MVHEQKFKDLLSSTCQLSVERIVLKLESEAMGSIPTGGNILSLECFCFHTDKTKMPNIHFCVYVKNPIIRALKGVWHILEHAAIIATAVMYTLGYT